MKRREIRKCNNTVSPKCMVTYSDIVTLILVFFILLFSMSRIDLVKFEAISDSFRNRMIFDFYPSPVPMENPTEHTSSEKSGRNSNEFENPTQIENINDRDDEEKEENDELNDLLEEVENYLDKNELNDVISATRTERGVVLVLQELILFNPGEAEILPTGETFLKKVGTLLSKIPNKIKVEGHTDSTPMSSFRYPSNWELSGARASSVIRYLIDEFDYDMERF